MADKLVKIVEDYFSALRDVRRLGAGIPERSYYPAVANLLNAIGADLKGRVICLSDGHRQEYADSKAAAVEWKDGAPVRGAIAAK